MYYATFPIREQAERADWKFELKAVYLVAILDFVFDADKNESDKYRYDVKLADIATNRVFYDKLTFIYLEMPKFNKRPEELETRFDKWLYVIKNLNRLDRVPEQLRERVFEQLFEAAEVARFTHEQFLSYEDSLKYYRDLKNSIDTAREEGMAAGRLEIAEKLLRKNMSAAEIHEITGLPEEEIRRLRDRMD